jgi:hypothetical protein
VGQRVVAARRVPDGRGSTGNSVRRHRPRPGDAGPESVEGSVDGDACVMKATRHLAPWRWNEPRVTRKSAERRRRAYAHPVKAPVGESWH